MGRNFVSICKIHRVKQLYFRGEEARPMHDFYKEHDACIRQSVEAVGTYDDQIQEELIPDNYKELSIKPEEI